MHLKVKLHEDWSGGNAFKSVSFTNPKHNSSQGSAEQIFWPKELKKAGFHNKN